MKHQLCCALAIALAAQAATGAPPPQSSGRDKDRIWFTDRQGNRFTYYLDSLRNKGGGIVVLWVDSVLPRPTISTLGMLQRIRSLEEFDCTRRRLRELAVEAYDAKGALLPGDSGVSEAYRPVTPGTTGEYGLMTACQAAGYPVKGGQRD